MESMTYTVKEIFLTLQGEGVHTGRRAVFCRFVGCNLWSGRERDRSVAVCSFCDTDFIGTDGIGGGRFEGAKALAQAIATAWNEALESDLESSGVPYVVFTGGEPALQLDGALVEACHAHGFEVGVETNGTKSLPEGVDWVCVSPKSGAPMQLTSGDELKVVIPQQDLGLDGLEEMEFSHFFVQPMDGPHLSRNMGLAVEHCMRNPKWRLSLQTHKLVGIP